MLTQTFIDAARKDGSLDKLLKLRKELWNA